MLFAEDALRPEDPARLAEAGFAGAMIDTAGKDGRRLPDLLDALQREAFIAACRACGLVSGLAGSLGVEDIALLARHRPGYLGFRGGLCVGRSAGPTPWIRGGSPRPRRASGRSPAGRRVSARPISVIKIGGSLLADGARLRAVLTDIAAGRDGACILVPGGGPFADAVRAAQAALALDDALAHRLALDAMGRMAEVLCALEPRLARFTDPSALVGLIEAGRVPIWDPAALKAGHPAIAESWDVTSDSLALWLATEIRAARCIVVKSAPPPMPRRAARTGPPSPPVGSSMRPSRPSLRPIRARSSFAGAAREAHGRDAA